MGVTRKKGLTSKTRKPGNQVTRKGPFSGWASEYTALGAPGDRLGTRQELRGHWTQCPAKVSWVQKAALERVTAGGWARESKGSEWKRRGQQEGSASWAASPGQEEGCAAGAFPRPLQSQHAPRSTLLAPASLWATAAALLSWVTAGDQQEPGLQGAREGSGLLLCLFWP